jgi:flagellar basal-body rod protein FlgF
MENAGYIGLSQQMALARRLEITANNLANLNTTAFKGESPIFEEYLVTEPDMPEMSYVHDYGTFRDMQEGEFNHTGRPLDVAINGDAFFVIDTENGLRYTRSGSFRINEDGILVTNEGDQVLNDTNQPIEIDLEFRDVVIAPDGTLSTGPDNIDRIGLSRFDNPQALKKIGNGLYSAENAEPLPAENSEMLQGTLERSNISPILEMSSMIDILRSYQSAQQLLDTGHDLQMKTIEELPAIQ